MNPKISVITVVFQSESTIEKTINSVLSQDYDNIEYIIVDGGSTDGTIDIIKKYEKYIACWVSENDRGIYDAMNKAIKFASGEWVNFMNSGDCYVNCSVLSNVFKEFDFLNYSFVYSDFFVLKRSRYVKVRASYEKGVVLHQSVIYRKSLHEQWGDYLVTQTYIISDYFFFNQIPKNEIIKTIVPISINSAPGVSGGEWCWYQKLCLDYFFCRISVTILIKKLVIRILKNKVLFFLLLFKK